MSRTTMPLLVKGALETLETRKKESTTARWTLPKTQIEEIPFYIIGFVLGRVKEPTPKVL